MFMGVILGAIVLLVLVCTIIDIILVRRWYHTCRKLIASTCHTIKAAAIVLLAPFIGGGEDTNEEINN